jgi:hypothetical protein
MKFFVLVFVVVLASMMPLLGFANASAQTPPRPDSPVPSVVPAPFTDHWRLNFSPYSLHYSHNPEHRPVWMLGLEKQRSDSYVWGATYFSNSFGQDSGYLYGGQRFENFTKYDAFFAQWTAGILYGYKGQYANKVPFNHGGFSPGLVLSLGWQFTPTYSAQLNVLGNSALMFQVSMELH